MNTSWDNEKLTIELEGRIDSGNAAAIEGEIADAMKDKDPSAIVLDAEGLDYISSAGLRVILRLRKKHPDLSIINVKSDVFEVFEMIFSAEKRAKTDAASSAASVPFIPAYAPPSPARLLQRLQRPFPVMSSFLPGRVIAS